MTSVFRLTGRAIYLLLNNVCKNVTTQKYQSKRDERNDNIDISPTEDRLRLVLYNY